MFSFWKTSKLDGDAKALYEMINKKTQEIIELQDKLTALQNEYDKLRSDQVGAFVFDWKGANAVAIERMNGQTVIGYKAEDCPDLKEWFFYCDVGTHNQLAAEFKEYINGKQ